MKIIRTLVFLFILLIRAEVCLAQGVVPELPLAEKLMHFVIQLGVIIVIARLGGMVFEKVKLPAVLGEIVAGIIISPYLLGGIPLPGLPHGLFPRSLTFPVSGELYAFGTVASIILLFLVGLETDIDLLKKFSLVGFMVGIGGVIVSFICGGMLTVLVSRYVFGTSWGFMHPVPLFLGVISTATSVGITARILTEKRKLDSPECVTILSGAVIDDILGIILLAIVVSIAKEGHLEWHGVGGVAIKSISIWLGFTVAGLLLSRQISNLLKSFKDTTTIAVMGLGLALIIAGIFEKAGLAMIIGAYITGLSLSQTDLAYVIQDKLAPVYKLFVPAFFCIMGMLVNLPAVFSTHILMFGVLYTIFAILSKIVGCCIPAMFFNFNLRGALRVGIGMIPRGEVALIVAGIGLANGIINHEMFGVAIMMTFVTTLVTPPILVSTLASDKPVLRKEVPLRQEYRKITFDIPNPETAELILNKIVNALNAEGFYVHLLDISRKLYQIRKDKVFITMEVGPTKLEFECKDQDAAFVHTLFYEVLAELERVIKQLQTLTDRDLIGKKIFEEGNGKYDQKIKLVHYISPLGVSCNLTGKDKREVIEELLDLLIQAGQVSVEHRGQALKDLFDRENTMSTGLQHGIAIPHTRTDAVDKLVCSAGIHREGVEFKSLDGEPSKIFFMILAPKRISTPNLQLMAAISQKLLDAKKRETLLKARDNDELYKLIIS